MRAIQRLWPRLATNLNDLENLSDHIHYYSTSQDSLAPMYKQKEEETKAKALLKKSQWDKRFCDVPFLIYLYKSNNTLPHFIQVSD